MAASGALRKAFFYFSDRFRSHRCSAQNPGTHEAEPLQKPDFFTEILRCSRPKR
ncbi:hypothetical protein [Tychonema sp. LEGE 07203]|uniref:hypothetical protein n=1 Tax=Tychonema sp. LEGE 07203 TaxID=1828671 RepID=UPI00187FAC4B|nr:hypothetical protein [Tychonema sp. LEGE 07203]MBE9097784.1 hypothetical protein [Tychonema sp. LEGE 07203]